MRDSATNIGDSRQARARESKSRLTNRTPANIADELRLALKREADNILTIGDLLLQAKAKVNDANWLQWLKQELAMSERSAWVTTSLCSDTHHLVMDGHILCQSCFVGCLSGKLYRKYACCINLLC
jgi:hypothetical protein